MMRDRFTVGVEEEYQLVEPGSGELRSRAGRVLKADRTGAVEGEVQDTMLEIGTPICRDAAEIADSLRERRFQASAAAAAEDLEILAAGVHPFSDWAHQKLTDGDRPRMLLGIFRHILQRQHIWGMHVHVAVPPEIDRAVLMNSVRAYSPHLLALSCSSPFQVGVDTGFASFRGVAWRTFPFTGAPPRFDSDDDYRKFVAGLLKAGTIPDARTIYWSVRPSSRFPTLELRMCDACPRISDAVAIAALGRALVVAAAEERLDPVGSSLSHSLQDEILAENEWFAARDGLEASLIAPEAASGSIPIRAAIAELLEGVGPVAEALGDGDEVREVERILESGNASDRMRAQYAGIPDLRAIVDWLVEETRVGTGIDRRHERRDDPIAPPVVDGV
jgi:carboxylate-amine ligase